MKKNKGFILIVVIMILSFLFLNVVFTVNETRKINRKKQREINLDEIRIYEESFTCLNRELLYQILKESLEDLEKSLGKNNLNENNLRKKLKSRILEKIIEFSYEKTLNNSELTKVFQNFSLEDTRYLLLQNKIKSNDEYLILRIVVEKSLGDVYLRINFDYILKFPVLIKEDIESFNIDTVFEKYKGNFIHEEIIGK